MVVKKNDWKLIINIGSIIFLSICCIYFGGRFIYFYLDSKEVIKQESNIIATILKQNNQLVTESDGLYKENKEYVFKGMNVNNYLEYSGYIWRAIKINKNNSVKFVMDKPITALNYGINTNYNDSNIYKWLNKIENVENTGIFFDTLNNPYQYLSSTKYCLDILDESINKKCNNLVNDVLVTILGIDDYRNMGLNKSFVNNAKFSWLLQKDKEDNLLYINEKGNISKADNYANLGIKPVITINQRINVISGKGTKELPLKIEQETNYTNKVVKLGDDIWNIINCNNSILKLSLDRSYINLSYSNKNSRFEINNKKNIANYLNTQYLNTIGYKDKLIEGVFYNSELSDEEGYDYENLFKNKITAKIGLLNMSDIKNSNLSNYYLMNLTSKLGEVAFTYNNSGRNDESLTTEKKGIVPVIYINKDIIKEGDGTVGNPYLVK